MDWDLGLEGMALLGAISLGFGVLAALVVGGGAAHRLLGAAVTAVACFVVGLLVSEWMFGWATEDELQPNIDGLSRDEALLSSVVTTALVVLVMRRVARHAAGLSGDDGRVVGRHSARHHRA